MRIQIAFAKTEAMRYTGHLDLQRTWERTLRRARLPLAYTQGFKPHPRINLPAALPLGYTSEAELVEVWLQHDLPLDEIESALREAFPPGLQLKEIRLTDERAPKLQKRIRAAEYRVMFTSPAEAALQERVEELLAAPTLPRERRGKEYDLRPLIDGLRLVDDCTLWMRLTARPGATGRPDEVLLALGVDPHKTRIHRTALVIE